MAPLPSRPIGFTLGQSNAILAFECFIDLACPFSKRLFQRITRDLWPSLNESKSNNIKFIFYQVPQPWHPQGSYLHEAAIAVRKMNENSYIDYCNIIFDHYDDFRDIPTFNKSRSDIYNELSQLVEEIGLNKDEFLSYLIAGENKTTQDLKYHVKFHRKRGVHVTPTVFLNGLEASQISSGWTMDEWNSFLNEMLNEETKEN